MSRTLLFSRAIALHHPRQAILSMCSFSTSKPSKGDKEKRQAQTKNFCIPGPDNLSKASTTFHASKKRGRPSKKGEGPPILIPPGRKQSFPSLPSAPFDRSHSSSEDPFVQDLWSVNVSPFLDPQDFCKRSAFFEDTPTRNGTLAARRLLRGKEQVVEKLQENILQSTRPKGSKRQRANRPRSYVILGHGVPKQLLQAHIDLADFLLKKHKNAAEITFKNSSGNLSVETMRVCAASRVNRTEPFDQDSEEDTQMKLYLTVMNRISTHLSQVLWQIDAKVPTAIENVDDEEEDDDFVRSPSSLTATQLNWKVDMIRGMEHPSDSILNPIVEWSLPENDSSPGYIAIRLRGQPTRAQKPTSTKYSKRQKAPVEVTMTFRATFENPGKPKDE